MSARTGRRAPQTRTGSAVRRSAAATALAAAALLLPTPAPAVALSSALTPAPAPPHAPTAPAAPPSAPGVRGTIPELTAGIRKAIRDAHSNPTGYTRTIPPVPPIPDPDGLRPSRITSPNTDPAAPSPGTGPSGTTPTDPNHPTGSSTDPSNPSAPSNPSGPPPTPSASAPAPPSSTPAKSNHHPADRPHREPGPNPEHRPSPPALRPDRGPVTPFGRRYPERPAAAALSQIFQVSPRHPVPYRPYQDLPWLPESAAQTYGGLRPGSAALPAPGGGAPRTVRTQTASAARDAAPLGAGIVLIGAGAGLIALRARRYS